MTTDLQPSMEANHALAVVGGVDTHLDVHLAAVLSLTGALLGTAEFAALPRKAITHLLEWMSSFGALQAIGVEGSGNYGAGLTRFLLAAGCEGGRGRVRPDRRRARRFNGNSDTLDAQNAARAVLAGERISAPKHRDGTVEALRALRVAGNWAMKARRAALQLLPNTIVSAPDKLRSSVSGLRAARCSSVVPVLPGARSVIVPTISPTTATRIALRSLARRILQLEEEIEDLDKLISALVKQINPRRLLEVRCVGVVRSPHSF